MDKEQLTIVEMRDMILYTAEKMIENTELLTHADQAIGDGDHGIGMERGFRDVIKKIEEQTFVSIGDLLGKVGMTLLSSVGGAAGAIFGTLFRGGAKSLKEMDIFDSKALSLMLEEGLDAIIKRGNAKPGDKTMVDALDPAVKKSKDIMASSNIPISESLEKIAEEARIGMERTKKMVAIHGKAKTLGERSLGYADPGSISMYLILKSMADYVKSLGN